MGLLDFLFRKEKQESLVVQEQPVQPHSIDSLQELLEREQEKRGRQAVEASSALVSEIKRELEELKAFVKEFEKAPVPATEQQRIAVEMKQNFLKRVSILFEAPFPDNSFSGLKRFSDELLEAIVQVTKAVSDNRYIYFFFKSESADFSSRMKRLTELLDGLRKKVDSTQGFFREFDRLKELLVESRHLRDSLDSLNKDLENNLDKLKSMESLASEAQKRLEASEKAFLEQEAEQLAAELLGLKNKVSESLLSLQRPLRKYEKVCLDKTELKTIKSTVESPIELVSSKDGLNELLKLLDSLRKAIESEKVALDEAESKKVVRAIELVSSNDFKSLTQSLAAVEKKIGENKLKLREVGKLEHELDLKKKDVEHQKKLLAELQRKKEFLERQFSETKLSIETKSKELFGWKVILGVVNS